MSITSGMKLGMSRAIGLVLILVLGSASGVLAAGQPTRYLVKDTGHGFAGLPSSIQPIFWLDDNRILYTGWDPNIKEIRKDDGQSVAKVGIYVFDLSANTATRHADAEGFLCYRNGIVRYLVAYDPKTRIAVRREGKFPEEREVVMDMKTQTKPLRLNPLNCRDYDPLGYLPEIGHAMPLLDGHGLLQFGRKGPPGREELSAATLHLADGKNKITLPVQGNAIYPSFISYYEFANSYIIGYLAPEGPPSSWPKGAAHRIYLLKPDGTVSEVLIPGGPWSERRLLKFALTRAGLLFHGGEIRRWRDPGTSGIYLSDGNRVTKLQSGELSGIGVSPNGCKVAVGMRTYAKIPDRTTLRIVDVCGEEGRK